MADVTNKHVLTNAKIEFGGVDISSKASNLTVEDTAEEIDFTAFSENGYREFGPGLKDANLSFTVFTTYGTAADAIDSLIGDAYRSGDPVAVSVQPDAAGTTGQFSMLTKVYSFSPISGAVGEANVSEVSLRNAGTAGLVVGGTANL